MSLYRHLLRTSPLLRPYIAGLGSNSPLFTLLPSRSFAFSSAEEAAAERRRRKRRLRIEPPLHALRRDPSVPRPPPDPNAPRLPDSTSRLVGPRLSLHNRVQSLIRSSDLDSASAAARNAVFSSVRPTVFTCNAIIAAMYRAKRYDDAVALFRFFFDQSNIVPNVVSYNFLIVTHCEAGRVDDALAVYKRILDTAPFSPSHITYRHLTKGLVDADRITDALNLLREMITRGHGADSLVFNNVIAGYLERENLEKAMELFDELRERCLVYDGTVVATFMDWYFRKGRAKEAMDEYQALLDKQFQMLPATCNALLEVLLKHGKEREANRLFEGMLLRHTPPSFNAINTDTYNIMVDECFKKGDFEGAVEVFHKTGTKPCVMDVGCFNNIISKLVENGLVGDARKLFDEMPEKSVNADAETYGFFIGFYFKEGKVEDALQWFENMVMLEGEKAPRVRVDSYNKVYTGLVEAGKLDIAMEIFKKMWERGLKPDSACYEILVTASCNGGLLDQVRNLVEEMVRIRASYSPELRELVSETFNKEGRGEEVEKMFTPPRPVVAQTPQYRPTRTAQPAPQNPNFRAYAPPYNADSQYSHAGGSSAPHVPSTQDANPTGPLQFSGLRGTNSTPTPQHGGDPHGSIFAMSHQPQDSASAGTPQSTTQPLPFAGPQTANAVLLQTSQLSYTNQSPYTSHSHAWPGNFTSTPQHISGHENPNFTASHGLPHTATAGNPHFAARSAPSVVPQTANSMPFQASKVTHTNSQPPYMSHSNGFWATTPQANNFQQDMANPGYPHAPGSPFPRSQSYWTPDDGNSHHVNYGTPSRSLPGAGSRGPSSASYQAWNAGDPKPMGFSASQHSTVAGTGNSGTTPPPFPFGSQSGATSQDARYGFPSSNFTNLQTSAGMSPATGSYQVPQNSSINSPQNRENEETHPEEIASGAYGRI